MQQPMITLPQASKLTGRHEDTIRRFIKQLLKTDPVAKDKITQQKTVRGFYYLIDQEYLVSKLQPLQSSNKGSRKIASNQPSHLPLNNVAHQPLQTNHQPSYAELK
jgi:predicted transcriptional regulator